jgi:DNA-binding CsgD family transcriptional regulator/type II secretory pathway predicted ATPase ExeA
MIADWPLIGRRAELARIAELLGATEVRGIVLAGTSGVGKTRLGDECLRLAEAAGFSTARVSATRAAAAIPLGALSPLLTSLDTAAGPDLLSKAAAALTERADGRPQLVLVDDAHLLDDASAALLHQVAMDAGIFVVATLRNGEPVPDAVVALWKDGHAERLDIKPLGQAECDELITHVLGGAVDGGSLLALWKASEGIPLVLRELLLGAQEVGSLVADRGVWRLRGAPVASGRLLELIDARLAALDANQRQALELLALGEPVPLAVLEACVGLGPLTALEEKGFMELRDDGKRTTAWLVHPLHGEVLRRSMPTLRARMVRRTLAETTEATGGKRRDDLLRIATWRVDSGAPGEPALLTAAGRQAYFADDYPVAEQLARAAVDAGGGVAAGHLLGQVLCEMGHRAEAEVVLAEAQALVDDSIAEDDRALLAITRSDNLFWGLARYDDADVVLRDVEAQVSDAGVSAQLIGQRASFELMLGQVAAAVERVEPLLESATGRAFVEACVVAEPALTFDGQTERAVQVAERGFAAHLELGDQMMTAHPGIHFVSQCLALNASGRVADALPLAKLGYDAAAGVRRSAGQAWFAMILGTTALTEGRVATAQRWFREGAAIFGELGHHGHRWCLGGLGMACGMLGDVAGARSLLADLEAAPPTQVLLSEPEVLRGRAWSHFALGDVAAARKWMDDAVEVARATGQRPLELAALHDAARLGDPTSVAARMAEVAERVEGPLAPIRVRHVRATGAGDGAALDAVADEYEALGILLLAAEAAAEAVAAHARAGDRRRSEAAAVRSQALAAGCEGARTPVLLQGRAPVPLTARERDVVGLAAQGLSSKAIAERLYLSVRTVDNHLQRAYTKLGVGGRDDLAAALDLLPPAN